MPNLTAKPRDLSFTILDNHVVRIGDTTYVDARLVEILLNYTVLVEVASKLSEDWLPLLTETEKYAGADQRSKSLSKGTSSHA